MYNIVMLITGVIREKIKKYLEHALQESASNLEQSGFLTKRLACLIHLRGDWNKETQSG